jgi:hypothetical protein
VLLREAFERTQHGRAADAHVSSELLGNNRFARQKSAVDDHLFQALVDVIVEVAALANNRQKWPATRLSLTAIARDRV